MLLCDLSLDEGTPVTSDDLADLPSPESGNERSAPAVSVFEGSRRIAPGIDAVQRGGTGGAAIDGEIPDEQVRTLVELLASEGLPLDTSLGMLRLDGRFPVRFAGDPATNVSPPNPPLPRLVFVESTAESNHRISFRTVLCPSSWIGSEYELVDDHFHNKTRLTGCDPAERPVLSSEVVVALSREPDTTLFLNGQFVSSTTDLTVEDVEESARKALARDGSDVNRAENVSDESRCHD
ncbi:hypothetical protein [Halorubrum sp. SD612]|uniref:hypothetical protein n=1 Tax=Halorubrum sp. SD612 TaxID=1855863 RepID=UPI001E6011E9|nr:hypothetical protein [Halorubrum sp. SD612]